MLSPVKSPLPRSFAEHAPLGSACGGRRLWPRAADGLRPRHLPPASRRAGQGTGSQGGPEPCPGHHRGDSQARVCVTPKPRAPPPGTVLSSERAPRSHAENRSGGVLPSARQVRASLPFPLPFLLPPRGARRRGCSVPFPCDPPSLPPFLSSLHFTLSISTFS